MNHINAHFNIDFFINILLEIKLLAMYSWQDTNVFNKATVLMDVR